MNTNIIMVKCFKCGKKLEAEIIPDVSPATVQPVYDGLVFRTHGNFGSRVFDPMMQERFLEIVICDQCILEHKDQVSEIRNIVKKVTADKMPFNTGETYEDRHD